MPDIDAAMGDDEADIERQLNEIRQIIKGKVPDLPEIFENHAVHISTIDKFGKGDGWTKLSPTQKQNLRDHRAKHIEFSIQLAQIQSALNVEPIKRSETLMIRPTSLNEVSPIERTQFWQKFGVQSDAAEIQLRGGLYIQDPAQAEMQAMNEDIEMMDMRAVQVSWGDNHIVHLETHSPVLDQLLQAQKTGQPVSDTVIQLVQGHIKDHIQAMEAIQSAPGLVPNDQISMPNQPNLRDTGPPGQMPQAGTQPQGKTSGPPGKSNQQAPMQQPKQAQDEVAPVTKPLKKVAPKGKLVQNKTVKPKGSIKLGGKNNAS